MKKIYIVIFFGLSGVFSIHAQRLGTMEHVVPMNGEVILAGKTKGVITKDELLNAGGLHLRKQLMPLYNIYKFHMILVTKEKGLKIEFDGGAGGELTPEMTEAIKQAKDGDKIYFERILCLNKKDSLYESDPIAFKLKILPPPDSTLAKSAIKDTVNHDTSQTH